MSRVCIINPDSPNLGAFGTVTSDRHWHASAVMVLCDGEVEAVGYDRSELTYLSAGHPETERSRQRAEEARARVLWRETKITRCPPGAVALPIDW